MAASLLQNQNKNPFRFSPEFNMCINSSECPQRLRFGVMRDWAPLPGQSSRHAMEGVSYFQCSAAVSALGNLE
jgi:hypothetical protein